MCIAPNTVMGEFFEQYIMVNGIKGLLQIQKQDSRNFLIFQAFQYEFFQVNNGVFRAVFFQKPKLLLSNNIIFIEKIGKAFSNEALKQSIKLG